MLTKAINLATVAHAGQLYNQSPYIEHPRRVAARLTDETEQVIAWLHDIVEDTPVTLAEIRGEFGDTVADAIDALTRRDGEKYADYILQVTANELAARVKIADLQDNIEQPAKAASLRQRYVKALAILQGPT